MSDLDLFAATAPGVAAITAGELQALGIAVNEVLPDGVGFRGDHAVVRRANVWLRTANRVVARMGAFRARTFAELERHAAALNWRAYVEDGGGATFRVTARKCRLFHTGAIAERLARAAGVHGPTAVAGGAEESVGADEPAAAGAQLFVVRGVRDEWQVSADSSGAHLHRRGYRLATAKAPLRETLAAAAVLASRWDRMSPLVDPFCGAGTICIEGALLASGRPPGAGRDFRFPHWPGFDAGLAALQDPPGPRNSRAPASISGYDRDAGAIAAARANAERAGVGGTIVLAQQSLSAFEPPAARGWIVTNPPYGLRVGDRGELRNLYARFGAIARERCGGWTVAFLSADPALERATGLRVEPVLRTENGGLPVRLVVAEP